MEAFGHTNFHKTNCTLISWSRVRGRSIGYLGRKVSPHCPPFPVLSTAPCPSGTKQVAQTHRAATAHCVLSRPALSQTLAALWDIFMGFMGISFSDGLQVILLPHTCL